VLRSCRRPTLLETLVIRIRGLSKSYRGYPVLIGVNAEVARGEIAFLMGKNGSGKTTLIKTMLNLETFHGDVTYDGRPLSEVYGAIGVVFDDAPVYRSLTGYQNIEVLCARRVDAKSLRNHARKFLSDRDLGRRAGRYSYGQRKKLALATALLGEPEYLIMDEVSNGLDYETMEWLKRELRERAGRTTILLTGHQFDFYDAIVDRVLVLKEGAISEVPIAGGQRRGLGVLYEEALKDAQG
jgi:ABC-type multidrug transport system ATPase subunit